MDVSVWQAPQLRRRLDQLASNLELLKAVCLEWEVIAAMRAEDECVPGQQLVLQASNTLVFDGDSRKQYLHRLLSHRVKRNSNEINEAEIVAANAAKQLQSAVCALLAPLQAVVDGTAPWDQIAAAARFRERRSKLKRNRKRRQKKRQQDAEYRRKAEERFQEADQRADEWRTREIAKDIAKQKMEKMNELAQRKAKEERIRLEEEMELVLLVEKLQELRAIRVQKLKKQGRFFPEEDDLFMERVRAAVEEEERQAAAAADTGAASLTIAHAEESGKLSSSTSIGNGTEKSPPDGQQQATTEDQGSTKRKRSPTLSEREGLPAEFYRYYYGSRIDMETLIEVRRSWDTFIMPGGSRIPGHWVQPSPPSTDIWASHLRSRDVHEETADNLDRMTVHRN